MLITTSHDYATLRQGLVGAWCPSLPNGGSGNLLVDQSSYGNHGVLTNMAADDWVSSQYGRALDFDGTNDYVINSAPSFSVAFPFAISIWANISSTYRSALLGRTYLIQATLYGGTSAIFSIATDYSNSTDRLYYFEGNAVRLTTETFTVNQWQHIAFCFDSTTAVRFFLNGRQGTIQQPSSFIGLGVARLFVGGLDGTAINCPALVDDIRFYNRVLTEPEIRLLASRPGIGLRQEQHRQTFYQFPSGVRRRLLLTGQT